MEDKCVDVIMYGSKYGRKITQEDLIKNKQRLVVDGDTVICNGKNISNRKIAGDVKYDTIKFELLNLDSSVNFEYLVDIAEVSLNATDKLFAKILDCCRFDLDGDRHRYTLVVGIRNFDQQFVFDKWVEKNKLKPKKYLNIMMSKQA